MQEIDDWIEGYKVRAFPWVDGKRIYFNVQYFRPGTSIEKPPVWDKTVFVTDDDSGRGLVFKLTHSLTEHVAMMQIDDNTEVTLTALQKPFELRPPRGVVGYYHDDERMCANETNS